MTRFRCTLLIVLTALLAAGCSVEYERLASEGGEGSGTEAEASPEVGEDAAAEAPDPGAPGLSVRSEAEDATRPQQPVEGPETPWTPPAESSRAPLVAPTSATPKPAPRVKPQPVAVEPRPAAAPRAGYEQPLIQLSTGVALAQSLPIGTTMGFSVDYEFTSGAPGSSPYVWVINASKGETKKQPVQLQARGTLQGFFPPWRPQNGPFSTHIEDAHGNRVSKSLPLR